MQAEIADDFASVWGRCGSGATDGMYLVYQARSCAKTEYVEEELAPLWRKEFAWQYIQEFDGTRCSDIPARLIASSTRSGSPSAELTTLDGYHVRKYASLKVSLEIKSEMVIQICYRR